MATPTGSVEQPPRWSLTSVYPAIDSAAYRADVTELEARLAERLPFAPTAAGEWVRARIAQINRITDLYGTLEAFCYAQYSVATDDEATNAALNRITRFSVNIRALHVDFRDGLAQAVSAAGDLEAFLAATPELARYRFYLTEQLVEHGHQMSIAEEQLAADLNRAGGDAWSRLQESVSSMLSMRWDDGSRKTVVQLRALAFDPDREIRRRAYQLELEAWQSVEIPLAFAINGVKGFSDILNTRRGWPSTLERSLRQSRVSPAALDALIDTMRDSLPIFRRYLRAKARTLGLSRLSFYDIFAPLQAEDHWTFAAARSYVTEQFGTFSAELGELAARAFDEQWIDALPRPGKVGGAYCIDFPTVGEPRVLANFQSTFHDVSTLAHELGHAYHSFVLRDLTALERDYPMTLAETASIFCETLVFHRRLSQLQGPARMAVLEGYLQESTQVIVDILSRFEFESRLMEQRAQREVSPRELCAMMTEAQRATYGDALNEEELHPYMWAVKGHYYRPDLAFYNFPYAFGQLFALGLFAQYQLDPTGFPARYRELLRATGRADAMSIARLAGCEIEDPVFWHGAVQILEALVQEFILCHQAC